MGILYAGIMSRYRLIIVVGVVLFVVAAEGMQFGRTIRDEDDPPPDDSDEYEDRMVAVTSHALDNSTLSGTGHVHKYDTNVTKGLKLTLLVFLCIAVFVGLALAVCLWKRRCSSQDHCHNLEAQGMV